MADDIDKLVEGLQEAILAGYSQKFKDELFNPKASVVIRLRCL